jgi:hypothetical protein
LADDQVLKKIRHVFIVVLENEGFDRTFGPGSPAPYLARQLPDAGALLKNYYGIGHFSLDNYIAMVSGQAPNPVTQSDCSSYVDFVATGVTADGQAIGRGCVYPANIKTIADQLQAAGLSWKGYMEDMGNDPKRETAPCGRPKLDDKNADLTQHATADDSYAARHNPFVYFHSIVDGPTCASNVVTLAALKEDLRAEATTPNFAFITPNLCHDGHDEPCAGGRAPGGFISIDIFLEEWVPQILASPAFKKDGLLVITFDEADTGSKKDPKTGKSMMVADARACCAEPKGPNIGAGSTVFEYQDKGPGVVGPGGGRIGAVALSRFIAEGTISAKPYNHYALLRTVETIFGLPYLGYAGQKGLEPFGADVFTQPSGSPY